MIRCTSTYCEDRGAQIFGGWELGASFSPVGTNPAPGKAIVGDEGFFLLGPVVSFIGEL